MATNETVPMSEFDRAMLLRVWATRTGAVLLWLLSVLLGLWLGNHEAYIGSILALTVLALVVFAAKCKKKYIVILPALTMLCIAVTICAHSPDR